MSNATPDEIRREMADDPHRPAYHFLPPSNWMNDPNGLIQFEGRYHLFYQHNPDEARWRDMHWGHAVSDDLVRWDDLPVALEPSADGPDADGCWSGCAIDDDGTPAILYTGVRDGTERQCLATSSDANLATWDRYGTVIESPPAGMAVTDFRDPYVWREGDGWRMLVGAGVEDEGAVVLDYESSDLREWTYRGRFFETDEDGRDSVWECPSLLDFGDESVLIGSLINSREVVYYRGTRKDGRFSPDARGLLDHGDFYAPQATFDEDGRALLWGWLIEERPEEAHVEAGWAGVMSLPRELSIRDGRLRVDPVPELRELRETQETRAADLDRERVPADVRGDALELLATFEPDDATAVGLNVRRSPNGEESTRIVVDRDAERLRVDRERSSLDPSVESKSLSGPLSIPNDEPIRVRVFVDRSAIEVFANDCRIAARVYPEREDSTGVGLFAEGGRASATLDAWGIEPIWPVA